jgi:hypothetical protein
VQTAVDAETGLIVHHEVTNEPNDTRQLYPMAKATKDTLGAENLTVVADAAKHADLSQIRLTWPEISQCFQS